MCNAFHVKLLEFYGINQQPKTMKKYILRFAALFIVLFSFTSCELIGDIFQAGLFVGILIVVLILALIFWIVRKFRK